MSTETNSDPLDIFAEAPTSEDRSESSNSNLSANPFDPLGGSQASLSAEKTTASESNEPLDLISQISSWGAQNKDTEAETKAEKQPKEPVSPTTHKANIMATKENALELSDDLVAEAHREFEATEDQLRKFEQDQLNMP